MVIKIGGEVVEAGALAAVAADVARAGDGGALVRSSTAAGRRRPRCRSGSASSRAWSAGRRITDAATLDVMKMVVAGQLNVDLCAALRARRRAGGRAARGRAASSRAHRRPPRVVSGGGPEPVDIGLVGDVVGFDLALLEPRWRGGGTCR